MVSEPAVIVQQGALQVLTATLARPAEASDKQVAEAVALSARVLAASEQRVRALQVV